MKKEIEEIAKRAGEVLLKQFNNLESIRKKGKNDIVTSADMDSEKLIIKEISDRYPTHSILSEEMGSLDKKSDYCWLIDPLDGTVNYASGLPFFSVSMGLSYKNEIISGLVYDPVKNETFRAEKGKGAFLNGNRIAVSKTKNLEDSLIGISFRGKKRPDYFDDLLRNSRGARSYGSAALELAYVACGRLGAYVNPSLHPWDTAAGSLIVREAGGRVTDFNGKETFPFDSTLATNGKIHDSILMVIQKSKEPRYKKSL